MFELKEFDRVYKDGEETVLSDADLTAERGIEAGFLKDPTFDMITSEYERTKSESILVQNLEFNDNFELVFDFSANRGRDLSAGMKESKVINFNTFKIEIEEQGTLIQESLNLEIIKEENLESDTSDTSDMAGIKMEEEEDINSGTEAGSNHKIFKLVPNKTLVDELKEAMLASSTLELIENLTMLNPKYSCLKPQFDNFKHKKVKSALLMDENLDNEDLENLDLEYNLDDIHLTGSDQKPINESNMGDFDEMNQFADTNFEGDFDQNSQQLLAGGGSQVENVDFLFDSAQKSIQMATSEAYFSRAKQYLIDNSSLFALNRKSKSQNFQAFRSHSLFPENWVKRGKNQRKFKKILAKKKLTKSKKFEKIENKENFVLDFSKVNNSLINPEMLMESFNMKNPIQERGSKVLDYVENGIESIIPDKRYINPIARYQELDFSSSMRTLFTGKNVERSELERHMDNVQKGFTSKKMKPEQAFNSQGDNEGFFDDGIPSQLASGGDFGEDQATREKPSTTFSKKNLKINELKELILEKYVDRIAAGEITDLNFTDIFKELLDYTDEDENSICPHVIFLTVLHIINERGLGVTQINQDQDFKIFRYDTQQPSQ